MTSSSTWRLYVIIDRPASGERDILEVAAAAIRGGADVLQWRDKHASTRTLLEGARHLVRLTRSAGIPLIVNDRVDVALAAGADGVHLGQDDLSVSDARSMMGQGRLIGKSTHSVAQAQAAHREGADYIGLGPIYATPTKPAYESVGLELIRQVTPTITIPVVCIGGIDAGNVQQVRRAGATCIAVVRAVCCAPDPEVSARTLREALVQSDRPSATQAV